MRYLNFCVSACVCFHSNTTRGRTGVLEDADVSAGACPGGEGAGGPPPSPAGHRHRRQRGRILSSLCIICEPGSALQDGVLAGGNDNDF